MKNMIMLAFILSFATASDFGVEIGLIGQFPQNEFKNEGVPNGLGFDLSGLWYPNANLGIGLNLGGTQYGSSKRQIPFNYFSPLVTITEKTTNNIGYGHILFRMLPFSDPANGPVQTTFDPSNSKTDVLQISLGLHFDVE